MANWDQERIELKQRLAAEGISPVLRALKERLPQAGERYEDVLLLESRQNEANRKRLRNLLSDEELRRLYAQIRQDIMDLLDALQEDDFDAEAVAKKEKEAGPEKGNILYRIPDQMQMGAWTNCIVRISFEEEKLVENIDLDEHVQLDEIRISEVMRVELIDPDEDPPFSIQTIHSAEQFIDRDTYTEWLFRVKPLRQGTFPLLLKVSVIELIMGKERKRELVLTEEVIITAAAPEEREEQPLRSAGHFYTGGSTTTNGTKSGYPETIRGVDDSRTTAKRSTTGSGQEPVQPAPAPQPEPSSTRSGGSRLRYVLRSLTVALVAFAGLFGGLYAFNPSQGAWLATHYVQRDAEAYENYARKFPESSHAERAYWQVAKLQKDNDDYLTYLERYPSGKFTDSALRTMQEREILPEQLEMKDLTRGKNVRELAQETIDWRESLQEAERAPDMREKQEIIEAYKRKHPDTYFDREVDILQRQLDRGRWELEEIQRPRGTLDLEREEESPVRRESNLLPRQRDSLAWQKVRESGGEQAALKTYLDRYPQGVFADKARQILSNREEEEALQQEIEQPEFNQLPDADVKLHKYRNILRENLQVLDPTTAEDLLNLLDKKLPRAAPERTELKEIRAELTSIQKQLDAGRISREEARKRRQELRDYLQKIVDNL